MNIINSMLNSQKLFEVTSIKYDKQDRITQLALDLDNNPETQGEQIEDVDNNGLITAKDLLPEIVNRVQSMPQIEYMIEVLGDADNFFYQELKEQYMPLLYKKKDNILMEIETNIREERIREYENKIDRIKNSISMIQEAYQALDEIGFNKAVNQLTNEIGLDSSLPSLVLNNDTVFETGYFAIPAYSADTVTMRMELVFNGKLPEIEIQGNIMEVTSIKGYDDKIYYVLKKEAFLRTANGQELPFSEINKLTDKQEVLDGRIKMVFYRGQNEELIQVKDAILDFSTDQKLLAAEGNGYVQFVQ